MSYGSRKRLRKDTHLKAPLDSLKRKHSYFGGDAADSAERHRKGLAGLCAIMRERRAASSNPAAGRT